MAFMKIFNCRSHLFVLSSNTFRKIGFSRNKFSQSKSYSRIIYNMNTIYFQNEKGDDKFHINFDFRDQTLDVQKVMNFERRTSECLQDFLKRLEDRLGKLLQKKLLKKKKKNQVPDISLPAFNAVFFLNDEPLSNEVVFRDIFDNKVCGNLKLRILDSDYDVLINSPTIIKIELPEVMRIGSVVHPTKLEGKCFDEEKTQYIWFRSSDGQKDWMQCGEGFFYIPTKEDSQWFLKLKCIPKNDAQTGAACEVVSNTKVVEFKGNDEIEKRHESTKCKTNADEFRVVSYNILADIYVNTKEAKTTLFTYCDPDILDLNYRKDLLSFELRGYNADLICLQEVDKKVFKNYLFPLFKNTNYSGVFFEKEGYREGCAFFYDLNKFELLHAQQHAFTEEILKNPLFEDFREKIIANKKLFRRMTNLQSMVQVGVLKCLTQPNQLIVFGNTHLYFHPDADHIRLLQGLTAIRILSSTVEEVKKSMPYKQISILLCGDFNSTPECGFHQFLNEGSIGSDHIEWKSKEDEEIENVSYSHCLKMKSACGIPEYTNYTPSFKACLDYIYFQTDHLEVKQVVPFPTEEALSRQTAIPSQYFPSDHVALIADFKFKSS